MKPRNRERENERKKAAKALKNALMPEPIVSLIEYSIGIAYLSVVHPNDCRYIEINVTIQFDFGVLFRVHDGRVKTAAIVAICGAIDVIVIGVVVIVRTANNWSQWQHLWRLVIHIQIVAFAQFTQDNFAIFITPNFVFIIAATVVAIVTIVIIGIFIIISTSFGKTTVIIVSVFNIILVFIVHNFSIELIVIT